MTTPTDVLKATLVALCRYVIFAVASWLIKHGLVDSQTLSPENIGILAVGAAGVVGTLVWTYLNKASCQSQHHLAGRS